MDVNCIPDKDWLANLIKGCDSGVVGVEVKREGRTERVRG
jgi:hypothetical protein